MLLMYRTDTPKGIVKGGSKDHRSPPTHGGSPPSPHETADSTEPWEHHVFSYTYTPVIELNLETGHSRKLTMKDSNYQYTIIIM